MPKQLHTLLTENSTELSTGQKQRISILRALIREPKLLIMDEATSNLDSKTEDYILTKIVKMLPTITVIAASHRESYTKFSNQIIDLSSVVNK
jgi:ABC-type bacteriocin/lantibiotic exporter with double-glycine peptidase domain